MRKIVSWFGIVNRMTPSGFIKAKKLIRNLAQLKLFLKRNPALLKLLNNEVNRNTISSIKSCYFWFVEDMQVLKTHCLSVNSVFKNKDLSEKTAAFHL